MIDAIPLWVAISMLLIGVALWVGTMMFTDKYDAPIFRYILFGTAFLVFILPSVMVFGNQHSKSLREMARQEDDERRKMFNLRIDCISEGGQWFHEGKLYRCVPARGRPPG